MALSDLGATWEYDIYDHPWLNICSAWTHGFMMGPNFSKDFWCCPTSRPHALGNHRITLAKAPGGMMEDGIEVLKKNSKLHGTTPADGSTFFSGSWHYTSHALGVQMECWQMLTLAFWKFFPTRWAPTSYKQSYKPFQWPYKCGSWSYFILINGVMGPYF